MLRFAVTLAALALLALVSLNGCSYQGIQSALVWEDEMKVTRDISYGELPRQKLDVYLPKDRAPRAVIVFIYGGSWKNGERSLYKFLGAALTGRGYALVVPDYRLYPNVRYPAFVEDAASAIAWTAKNDAQVGRGAPLFLMGHSAGAHSAALIDLDPNYLRADGIDPSIVKGLIGLAGPYTFNPVEWDSTKDIFSTVDAKDADVTRPIKLVHNGIAPILLIHGTADTTVGPHNSVNFAAALKSAGAHVEVKTYDGIGHLGVVSSFAWPLRWRAPVLNDVDAFISKQLSPPAS